jgi:hypothetical protein
MLKKKLPSQSNLCCNLNAFTPTERDHHKQFTERLMALRANTVETETGYEFHFRDTDLSLTDLAEWVQAESKCCPFFDFQIALRDGGMLLCLSLTGQEGVKSFIRSEFALA